ncbi:MAG: 4-alpha-glucanotransferase [Gammaproteobacteria bacterium]
MVRSTHYNTVNRQRRAGVLLHPTSLPGRLDNGDIGHEAYRFIEYLSATGFKVWQMLPLGPTHDDKSPYQCLSSHAGNPALISIEWLVDKGWLAKDTIESNETSPGYRITCLRQAKEYFYKANDQEWMSRLTGFIQQHSHWLENYALFMALKCKYQDKPWYEWPEELRHRNRNALDDARWELQQHIKQAFFEQFVFFTQWHEIRAYARKHDVELFGDIPIFVARDSADVWSERKNFLMDDDGEMHYVAGVPPDAFSDTGQRWGNPLYDWDYMQSENYKWWKERLETQLELFDMVRIDHFRGLQACWQIPAEDTTAMNGHWVEVPGKELLQMMFSTFEHLPLIAEDLGVITEAVIALKEEFNLPGMKILQFAFDGNNQNPHLPHRHKAGDVVYTGTHDNDTTVSWAENEDNYNKPYFEAYSGISDMSTEQATWTLIRMAFSSVSFLCVIPMQDVLRLGNSARMNVPGTIGGNWQWRFKWNQINNETTQTFSHLMRLYER